MDVKSETSERLGSEGLLYFRVCLSVHLCVCLSICLPALLFVSRVRAGSCRLEQVRASSSMFVQVRACSCKFEQVQLLDKACLEMGAKIPVVTPRCFGIYSSTSTMSTAVFLATISMGVQGIIYRTRG